MLTLFVQYSSPLSAAFLSRRSEPVILDSQYLLYLLNFKCVGCAPCVGTLTGKKKLCSPSINKFYPVPNSFLPILPDGFILWELNPQLCFWLFADKNDSEFFSTFADF